MTLDAPLVTVLIPARDEAADIEGCLAAVLALDQPRDQLEVLVVDGASQDGTAALASRALTGAGLAGWRVIDNPRGTTPTSLNLGLRHANGEVVCRVDARSIVPSDYVRRCVEVLATRPEVVVVGGTQLTVSRDASARGRGIARALNNRWGMGLARYRRGAASGPADTVYLGAFRTEQVRALGGWDETLDTNQDFDLNQRLGRTGVVWFEAGLDVGYLPRADIAAVWRQYHRFGRWKVRYWRGSGTRPVARQMVILAVPPLAGALALWWSRARPSRLVGLVVLGLGATAVVDQLGAPPADDEPAARGVAVVTLLAVWSGWLSGVARELLAPRPGTGAGSAPE